MKLTLSQLRAQSRPRRRAASAALFGLVLAAGATGCKDADAPAPTSAPPEVRGVELSSLVPRGAVQAAVQQQAMATDGTITFYVRVLANGVGVSAYTGTVTFNPSAFELVSAVAPVSSDGAARFLNAGEFALGIIRFAGFTPTTFPGTDVGDGVEAMHFTVRMLRPLDEANLRAALSVVSGETGVAISSEHVLASPGVHDAAGNLIR